MKKKLWSVLMMSLLVLFAWSSLFLANEASDRKKSENSIEAFKEIYYEKNEDNELKADDDTSAGEISAENPVFYLDSIKELNEDYIGWITIEGTNIDYPVLQAEDNSYYISHGYFKESNPYGAIFMDSGCMTESRNIILYGHNTFGTRQMFTDLDRMLEYEFLKKHHLVLFNGKRWEIKAVFTTTVEEEGYDAMPYTQIEFETREDFEKWLMHNMGKDPDAVLEPAGQVLTLSTCLDFDGGRIVAMAVPIDEEE